MSLSASLRDMGKEVNKYGGKLTKEVKKSKGFDCSICDFTTSEADFLRGHVARLGNLKITTLIKGADDNSQAAWNA